MRKLSIKPGTPVFLGQPAKPLDRKIVTGLMNLVAGIGGIIEAHLPQCFVKDTFDPPAQVLVIVIDPIASEEKVIDAMAEGISAILPKDMILDIWPITPTNSILPSIRNTRCKIKGPISL